MRCLNLKQALADAGLEKGSEAFEKLDKTRAGILIGSGMGGLTVFQDGVKNLVEKGYKKITPFFIPYAITNMCAVLKLIVLAMVSISYSWTVYRQSHCRFFSEIQTHQDFIMGASVLETVTQHFGGSREAVNDKLRHKAGGARSCAGAPTTSVQHIVI